MNEFAETLAPWADDFELFCFEVFSTPLRPWQERAARLLFESSPRRLAVAKARGAGGTSLGCRVAAWYLATNWDGLVVYVTPVWQQSRFAQQEFASLYRESRLAEIFPDWEILADEIRTGEPKHKIIFLSGESGPGIEGIHARNILLIFDEAARIPPYIFRTVRAMAAGAREVMEIALSVPGPPSGWFYERWLDPRWKTMRVPAAEVPELADYVADMTGEDDAFARAHRDAQFADFGSEDTLFTVAMVEAAQSRTELASMAGDRMERVIGIDPSGGRHDEFAICLREGNRVTHIDGWLGMDPNQALRRALAVAAQANTFDVVLDSGGALSLLSTAEEIAQEDRKWGGRLEIHEFIAGSRAQDPMRYRNLKSEQLFLLQERFAKGLIALPRDAKLAAQLLGYTVVSDGGKRKTVDPSRSPDRADALVCCFAFDALDGPDLVGIDLVLPDGSRYW